MTDKAHARNTDPQTSHDAADSVMRLTEKRSAVLQTVLLYGSMTDSEIAAQYSAQLFAPTQSASGLRTRRSELVQMGMLRDSGKTKRLPSGRMSIVWEVNPHGVNLS